MLMFIWPYALYKMGKFSEAVDLNKFPQARDQAGIPDVWWFQLSFYTHSCFIIVQWKYKEVPVDTYTRAHTHASVPIHTCTHTQPYSYLSTSSCNTLRDLKSSMKPTDVPKRGQPCVETDWGPLLPFVRLWTTPKHWTHKTRLVRSGPSATL